MANQDLRGRYRRDYTREPIRGRSPAPPNMPDQVPSVLPGQPPLNTAPALANIQPAKKPRRRKQRRGLKKFFLFILIIALLAGLAGGVHLFTSKSQPAVPAKIKSQASVPILYPAKLPAGYQVIRSSFNISGAGIVAYYAEDGSGHRLNFTVQPRPTNFDFETFYSKVLTNATRFNTPLGEAAVGTANDRLLGSLATTKSWVIVSGNSKAVGADKIQTALAGIKEVN